MDWLHNNRNITEEDIPEDAIGFIYLITNLTDGQKYIGRKLLTKAAPKKKVIKKDGTESKRKKVQPRKESDWKNYFGSCAELKEDMKKLGKENFKREILLFCSTVSMLNYQEAKHQFVHGVLESDGWYNGNIMIRAYKKNIVGKE